MTRNGEFKLWRLWQIKVTYMPQTAWWSIRPWREECNSKQCSWPYHVFSVWSPMINWWTAIVCKREVRNYRCGRAIVAGKYILAACNRCIGAMLYTQWLWITHYGTGSVVPSLSNVYFWLPRAHAQEGVEWSVCLSVCPQSKRGLNSEGLVEGLFQDRSARIQRILAST